MPERQKQAIFQKGSSWTNQNFFHLLIGINIYFQKELIFTQFSKIRKKKLKVLRIMPKAHLKCDFHIINVHS